MHFEKFNKLSVNVAQDAYHVAMTYLVQIQLGTFTACLPHLYLLVTLSTI